MFWPVSQSNSKTKIPTHLMVHFMNNPSPCCSHFISQSNSSRFTIRSMHLPVQFQNSFQSTLLQLSHQSISGIEFSAYLSIQFNPIQLEVQLQNTLSPSPVSEQSSQLTSQSKQSFQLFSQHSSVPGPVL